MAKKTKTIPEKLKPFRHFGVDLEYESSAKSVKGVCPFCDKEDHFFVSQDNGQWSCKVCHESGNIYGFLKTLWEYAFEQTTSDHYERLSDDRKVSVEGLKEWGLAWGWITSEWLIPHYNEKGDLANLSRYAKVRKKGGGFSMRLLGCPTCKTHPFGTPLLNKNQKSLYVVEGIWDGIATRDALKTVKSKTSRSGKPTFVQTTNESQSLISSTGVLAVPGSGNFQDSWFSYFKGRKVSVCFDNDHPKTTTAGKVVKSGWDGQQRIAKLTTKSGKQPSSLSILDWGHPNNSGEGFDESLADGYDVRDLIVDQGGAKAFVFLRDRLRKLSLVETSESTSEVQVEPIARSSFTDLDADFASVLHWTGTLRDTLLTMLATVVSTSLPGEQLWVRTIGPPGTGKTTLVESIAAAEEYVFSQSVFTGFHSGFVGQGRKKDSSLIPLMDGKTFAVKDADTLVNAPNRDKLLAELRDIYDGTSRSRYRNQQGNDYNNLRITMLICGTDELRGLNRSFLGDRFVDCEILGEADQAPYLKRATKNAYNLLADALSPKEENDEPSEDKKTFLKQVTYGFVQYIKSALQNRELKIPLLDEATETKIHALAEFLSYMRARVNRDKEGMLYRPRPEVATRLSGQLTKLGFCYALILGKAKVDSECVRLLRKIVHDTSNGFPYEIVSLLMRYPKGLSKNQVAHELQLPATSVGRNLVDMQELKIVHRQSSPNRSGVRGRDVHLWKTTDSIRSLFVKALGRKK